VYGSVLPHVIHQVHKTLQAGDPWPDGRGIHGRWLRFNVSEDYTPRLSDPYIDVTRMSCKDGRDKVYAVKGLFAEALQDLGVDYAEPL
jgi:hypothetical protein